MKDYLRNGNALALLPYRMAVCCTYLGKISLLYRAFTQIIKLTLALQFLIKNI